MFRLRGLTLINLKLYKCHRVNSLLNSKYLITTQNKESSPDNIYSTKRFQQTHLNEVVKADTEDILISKVDPIGLISLDYSPSIIRTLKEFKTKDALKNKDLTLLIQFTEKVLLKLNKRLSKKTHLREYSFFKLENYRSFAEKNGLYLAKNIRNDEELKVLLACMSILMPRSELFWISLDGILKNRIKEFNMESLLFCSYCFSIAKNKRSFRSFNFKLSDALIDVLINEKSKRTTTTKGLNNIFDFEFNPLNDIDVFAPICSSQLKHSKSVELLGLQLHLLSVSADYLNKSNKSKAILEDMTNHCLRVLTSIHNPIKLFSLRQIWEYAPRVDLPNSYGVYKSLYEQVLYSINIEPMQIINQEEATATLFESMQLSKYKNSQLINRICDLMFERGTDYQKVGVRMFNSLVELDCAPYALIVLEKLMKFSNDKLELLFTATVNSDAINKGVLTLSDLAKEKIYKYLYNLSTSCARDLNNKSQDYVYRTSDLILALYCFNREEKKSNHYRLLESIECSIAPNIKNFPLYEVTSLLHSYALGGRFMPIVMTEIDKVILNNYSQMNSKQLSVILWASARLNYKESKYILAVSDQFLHGMKQLSTLSESGILLLSRTLWSLAVLELLDFAKFFSVSHLLIKFIKSNEGSVHPWVAKQLTQVHLELLVKENNGNVSDDNQHIKTLFDNIIQWKKLNKRNLRDSQSSFTHLDASKLLLEMGVMHENEKILNYGYVVDIFIKDNVKQDSGIVIEFDGPTHFESYLNQTLGPTEMKRRHIKSLGYKLISIPFWKYKYDMTIDQKKKVLNDAVHRSYK